MNTPTIACQWATVGPLIPLETGGVSQSITFFFLPHKGRFHYLGIANMAAGCCTSLPHWRHAFYAPCTSHHTASPPVSHFVHHHTCTYTHHLPKGMGGKDQTCLLATGHRGRPPTEKKKTVARGRVAHWAGRAGAEASVYRPSSQVAEQRFSCTVQDRTLAHWLWAVEGAAITACGCAGRAFAGGCRRATPRVCCGRLAFKRRDDTGWPLPCPWLLAAWLRCLRLPLPFSHTSPLILNGRAGSTWHEQKHLFWFPIALPSSLPLLSLPPFPFPSLSFLPFFLPSFCCFALPVERNCTATQQD